MVQQDVLPAIIRGRGLLPLISEQLRSACDPLRCLRVLTRYVIIATTDSKSSAHWLQVAQEIDGGVPASAQSRHSMKKGIPLLDESQELSTFERMPRPGSQDEFLSWLVPARNNIQREMLRLRGVLAWPAVADTPAIEAGVDPKLLPVAKMLRTFDDAHDEYGFPVPSYSPYAEWELCYMGVHALIKTMRGVLDMVRI
jgi:hypothetical protein